MAFDKKFPSLNNNLYVMAQKMRDFDREAFLKKLKEADPWANLEVLGYKISHIGRPAGRMVPKWSPLIRSDDESRPSCLLE